MREHRYPTPDGEASYWTPTSAEIRDAITSSLSHSGLGSPDGVSERLMEQAQRMTRLRAWYAADGRDSVHHPDHGLYSGLAMKAAAVERGEATWGQPQLFAPVADAE